MGQWNDPCGTSFSRTIKIRCRFHCVGSPTPINKSAIRVIYMQTYIRTYSHSGGINHREYREFTLALFRFIRNVNKLRFLADSRRGERGVDCCIISVQFGSVFFCRLCWCELDTVFHCGPPAVCSLFPSSICAFRICVLLNSRRLVILIYESVDGAGIVHYLVVSLLFAYIWPRRILLPPTVCREINAKLDHYSQIPKWVTTDIIIH